MRSNPRCSLTFEPLVKPWPKRKRQCSALAAEHWRVASFARCVIVIANAEAPDQIGVRLAWNSLVLALECSELR